MIENLAADAGGMSSNAFLVWGNPSDEAGTDTGRRVLVDCGANFDAVEAVRRHVETLDAVVLTHTHPDHLGTLPELREAFGVETWGFDTAHQAVDHELGETVRLGTGSFEVVHTPGHEPAHVCLVGSDGVVFTGDLLFANGGFGRTDLSGGDRAQLIDSIERLAGQVDRFAALYPGHGPAVTDDVRRQVELALQAARQ